MKRKYQTFILPSNNDNKQPEESQETEKKKICMHNPEDNTQKTNQIDGLDDTINSSPGSGNITPEYDFSSPPSSPSIETHFLNNNFQAKLPKLQKISFWDRPVDRSDSQLTQAEWDKIDSYLKEKEEKENQQAWDEMKNATRIK